MREKLTVMLIPVLCILCGLMFGNGVSAAEVSNKEKMAYADPAKKALVLHFEDFSKKKKYTYSISSGGQVIAGGQVPDGGIYPLDNHYKKDTAYQLKITSSEKNTMTVYYYTGDAVSGFKISQESKYIKNTWKSTNAAVYNGYYICIYPEGNGIVPKLKSKITDSRKNDLKINGSSLENGNYTGWLIPYSIIDGKEHFGEGQSSGLTYIRIPSRVTGVTAVPNTKRVKLSWSSSSGAAYYRVYKGATVKGTYSLAMDNVTSASCTIIGLKPGSKYYFKVEPVAAYDTKTIAGFMSPAKGATVPLVAGKVNKVKPEYDSRGALYLSWEKTNRAYGYLVYYKKKTDSKYTRLCGTTKQKASLKNLTGDIDYQIIVYAVTKSGSKKYKSDCPSNVVNINPSRDVDKILAGKVRSITYVGKSREVYSTKKYSREVKTAFVNYRGYSSPTKYLIWVSHYTQQASIFKGEKGNWKMIRTFSVATGRARTKSPRGVFKIGQKEKGWYYTNTKVLYVSHYSGKNSFHTRPLYNGGGVATSTLNRPASHGCVRCPNSDAKYIYFHIPKGTTVVSY